MSVAGKDKKGAVPNQHGGPKSAAGIKYAQTESKDMRDGSNEMKA